MRVGHEPIIAYGQFVCNTFRLLLITVEMKEVSYSIELFD